MVMGVDLCTVCFISYRGSALLLKVSEAVVMGVDLCRFIGYEKKNQCNAEK